MKYLRLKKQADFERLFHKGKRAFSPSLTLIYRPSDSMRMGISIGKRHGKSVKRNRIKRLIRLVHEGERTKYDVDTYFKCWKASVRFGDSVILLQKLNKWYDGQWKGEFSWQKMKAS